MTRKEKDKLECLIKTDILSETCNQDKTNIVDDLTALIEQLNSMPSVLLGMQYIQKVSR